MQAPEYSFTSLDIANNRRAAFSIILVGNPPCRILPCVGFMAGFCCLDADHPVMTHYKLAGLRMPFLPALQQAPRQREACSVACQGFRSLGDWAGLGRWPGRVR